MKDEFAYHLMASDITTSSGQGRLCILCQLGSYIKYNCGIDSRRSKFDITLYYVILVTEQNSFLYTQITGSKEYFHLRYLTC